MQVLNSVKISWLILALTAFYVGSVGADCPVGNLNTDCRVNWEDLRILADQWLNSGDCSADPNCADLYVDNIVNMLDMAILADNWGVKGSYPLVINEFMALNQGFILDPADNQDNDWIEIYNYGDDPIDIGGMHLTDDDPYDPLAEWWQIPTGYPEQTTIAAGGYLLIWADNQTGQGPLHVNFALGASGEYIGLADADMNLLDSIAFGQQSADDSYGRFPDGNDNWQTFLHDSNTPPTPGKANGSLPTDIVISEIMYHPSSNPLNELEEYIELFNKGTTQVNLSGWQFIDGVDFNFPDETINAGDYLVVAADVNTFAAKYPPVTNVIGGWERRLRNRGEAIELVNAGGIRIDRVRYADEGDWAQRQLGLEDPPNSGFRGWEWSNAHDGDGNSLELINPALSNEYGQNWKASLVSNGTPGVINSVDACDIAPMIVDVTHFPAIPSSIDPVTVTARVIDELASGVTVTLYYRDDQSSYVPGVYPHSAPNAFTSVAMADDGAHGDGEADDGIYGAEIPAQSDGTIIEFYIEASDTNANSRTWPPPSIIDSVPEQVTNVLYHVDDSFDPNWSPEMQPIYYTILTDAEKALLLDFGDNCPGLPEGYEACRTDAQVNATFISIDGADFEMRYNVGMRIRGASSRESYPNNYRINFVHSEPWKDVTAINLNSRVPHSRIIGSAIFRMAEMPAPETSPVQLRVNGQNLNNPGSPWFGTYSHNEVKDGDFVDNHFPDDDEGNFYKCVGWPWDSDLTYLGTNPNNYIAAHYAKRTNEALNDYNDLIDLTYVLDIEPDETYVEEVNRVLNLDQWLRWFAIETLFVNKETNLSNGCGDDYYLYRGVTDPRFVLVAHDLDYILGLCDSGDTPSPVNESIFPAIEGSNILVVLVRFFNRPEFVCRYYGQLVELIETTFSPEQVNPLLDHVLGGVVPQGAIDGVKQWIADRNAYVLSQIPLDLTITSNLSVVSGFHKTASSTATGNNIDGTANAIETRSVRVNGQLVDDWSQKDGDWSITGKSIALNPGINRVIVQTFDDPNGTGNELERGYIDIWYDDSTESTLSGTLGGNMTLDTASGPWHITGNVTVPGSYTLTIEPGTTLFFDSGTRIEVTVGGRLVAEGTEYERIPMTRVPSALDPGPKWKCLYFNGTMEDNRLSYVDIEHAQPTGDAEYGSVRIISSKVTIDNVTWSGTVNTILHVEHPSVIVRNSVFPGIINGEMVYGLNIDGLEYIVLEDNIFSSNPGPEDLIDISKAQRPGPVVQILNNVFYGGIDDGVDFDGADAHIEGNVFMNFHLDEASRPTTSNAIATGEYQGDSSLKTNVTVVRNIFFNCDHAILLKEDSFATAINNTFVNMTEGVIQFDEPQGSSVQGPGDGAFLDGNIFWDFPELLKYQFVDPVRWPGYPDPNIILNRSIAPNDLHYLGEGNIDADPLFVDEPNDFGLKPISPAIGTGTNGLDMGAYVPAGASISSAPDDVTRHTDATLTVSGGGITHYKYQLDAGPWSAETAVNVPLELIGLSESEHTVCVIGKNPDLVIGSDTSRVWQDANDAASITWTVDTSYSLLVINEVLAHSHGEANDLIELYYDGPAPLDLSGMSISDDLCNPTKYVFPGGTTINPGECMVLYANYDPGHLGFALSQFGEGVYLYDTVANGGGLIDSIEFGMQLRDFTIGRLGRQRQWKLTQPTIGTENVAQPLGNPATLKINEWFTSGEVLLEDDFIEIYNPHSQTVDMGGMFLTDDPVARPDRHQIKPLSFIAGEGYTFFIADGDVQDAANHVDFRLSAEREMIGLFDAELNEIDKVIYYSQTTDVSEGRSPDGTDTFAFFELPTPGAANPAEGTSISTVTLVPEDANKAVLVPTAAVSDDWKGGNEPFDDSTWTDGTFIPNKTGGVGYERSSGFEDYITIDVESEMYDKRYGCYVRIPFTFDGDPNVTNMTLKVRYDDGFAAYINGVEVTRANTPAVLNRNSSAPSDERESSSFEYFDITDFINDLEDGNNILALHGLNASKTSSDFLISAELEVTTITTYHDDKYDDDLALLDGLRITELMYNPDGNDNVEFIEFLNIGPNTLDLTGVRFTDGIVFTFPEDTNLPAGEYLLVVKDPVAFALEYPLVPGEIIFGPYEGQLANNGEDIVLNLAEPLEAAILRFEYNDTWYPSTDGGGSALVISDPNAHPATWNDAESWLAAAPTPGQ